MGDGCAQRLQSGAKWREQILVYWDGSSWGGVTRAYRQIGKIGPLSLKARITIYIYIYIRINDKKAQLVMELLDRAFVNYI